MAHMTQATRPGWHFVQQSGGGGANLTGGGSLTAYVDPPNNGFTMVIYKPSGAATETATITLTGPAAALTSLHAVRSTVTRSNNPNVDAYFLAQPDVPVTNGVVTLTLRGGEMYTLSTVSTMSKGTVPAPPPPAVAWPRTTPYSDNFDGCAISQEA